MLVFPTIGKTVDGVRLVCEEPVFDFGRVDPSAVLTNVFVLRNEGDLTYVHKYVQSSCSCARARISRRLIGPGETARVTAVYTAARRRGPQRKSLRLVPQNSDRPALTLYLTGFVESPAESK